MRLRDAIERVAVIVQELEELDELPDGDYNLATEAQFDSLGMIELQQQVEDEFGIRFAPSEVEKMQTIRDVAVAATRWYY
jgi:acyl carrier protein